VIVPGEGVPNEICSRCGVRRIGSFRYCRSCAFDYEAPPPPPILAPTIIAAGPSLPVAAAPVAGTSQAAAAPAAVPPAAPPAAAATPAVALAPEPAPQVDASPGVAAGSDRTVTRLPTATRARAVLSVMAIGLAGVLVVGALASRIGTVAPSAAAGVTDAPVPTPLVAMAGPSSAPTGGVAGSVSQVHVVDDPIEVAPGGPVVLEGDGAIYTWRELAFAGPATTLRWAIVAPDDDDCRLDWRIKPSVAAAVQGTGTSAAGDREDGLVGYETAFGTATLTVVSDCASWAITLQAD
jgi:hypothetical protein